MENESVLIKLLIEVAGASNTFRGRSLLSLSDLSREEIELVLRSVSMVKSVQRSLHLQDCLRNKIIATWFHGASTRTRFSFESSMQTLGGKALWIGEGSSIESSEDQVIFFSACADILAIRHRVTGVMSSLAQHSRVPIINCGDGRGEHPTQGLVDLFTIREALGRLDNLKIAVVGDLFYGRAIHSFLDGLSHFSGNKVYCVSDPELALPKSWEELFESRGLVLIRSEKLDEAIEGVDVIYMSRLQTNLFMDHMREQAKESDTPIELLGTSLEEKLAEFEKKHRGRFVLAPDMLPDPKQRIVWVVHPLPKNEELSPEMDSYPGSLYFQQGTANAQLVRMALLTLILWE